MHLYLNPIIELYEFLTYRIFL